VRLAEKLPKTQTPYFENPVSFKVIDADTIKKPVSSVCAYLQAFLRYTSQ